MHTTPCCTTELWVLCKQYQEAAGNMLPQSGNARQRKASEKSGQKYVLAIKQSKISTFFWANRAVSKPEELLKKFSLERPTSKSHGGGFPDLPQNGRKEGAKACGGRERERLCRAQSNARAIEGGRPAGWFRPKRRRGQQQSLQPTPIFLPLLKALHTTQICTSCCRF